MKVTKTIQITKEGDWMIASTPNLDTDRDRINPMGIRTEGFEKNPVLFYGHNYRDPWAVIGNIPEFTRSSSDFRFRPELRAAANDADPMNIIRLLWDSKLLNASSIGFIPVKGKGNEFGGVDYEEIELLEISLVPLPANRDAIRLAMKALDLTDESDVFTKTIDDLFQKRGRVISAKNESLLRAAADNLQAVLSALGDEEPMSDEGKSLTQTETPLEQTQDNPAEPHTDTEREPAPLHDESEAALDEFAKALINLVENWSK